MSQRTSILLVDGDIRRRAAISHCLAGSELHVEPFEDTPELFSRWPREGTLLVHDNGTTISLLLAHMGKTGDWLPIIAFAEQPSIPRIVEAVLQGAVDYLAWPFETAELDACVAVAQDRARTMASSRLREAVARSRVERLTRREREVLSGVAGGLSNRLIGEKLNISPRTVEIHRAHLVEHVGAVDFHGAGADIELFSDQPV